MKIKLLLVSLTSILSYSTFSQTQFHIGGLASYAHDAVSIGGEVGAYSVAWKRIAIGPGVQVIKMKDLPSIYAPVFVTLGYIINKSLLIHADPGFAAYQSSQAIQGIKVENTGGFYIGSGLKYDFPKGPYINLQYSRYAFRSNIAHVTTTGNSNAVTLTIGWTITEL
jgi:hypothetical protein